MNNQNQQLFLFLSNLKPSATATIKGENNIGGLVEFFAVNNGVIVVADIDNLPKTDTDIFAFHIHEGASCDDNFSLTGGHYNPTNKMHPNHAGDLPPLFANNGMAWCAVFTNRFTIDEITKKTIIIHNQPDDFTTQPSGNSGEKIACGQIKKLII